MKDEIEVLNNKKNKHMKVLITGACAVTGRSVARSLRASKIFSPDLELIGTDIDVNLYGFYEKLYDKIYVMPRVLEKSTYL